jgi:hypothetical protein
MTWLTELPRRGVIAIEGEDRVNFLQGLVSNDVAPAAPGCAVWAALLTPQGKWLADFFIFSDGARLLLDCERDQIAMLTQRLVRFRLRARVAVHAEDRWHVYAAWGEAAEVTAAQPLVADALTAPDPRLPTAGWRLLAPHTVPATASEADWDVHRMVLGLPDGSRDLEAEKSVLLEAGFDELNGVSWTKGCYMGQELTARTKYRGLIKRRLMPVEVDGPLPASGAPIMRDGVEVGTMRSGLATRGLAVLRLDARNAVRLTCGDAVLTPHPPAWMHLPEPVT